MSLSKSLIPQFRPAMAKVVDELVLETIHSGFITQGKKVEIFEGLLQEMLGYDYGVTVNSATSGLTLALHLVGARPGRVVISTPMTCSATNEAIYLSGADIAWADVDVFGNIKPESVHDLMGPDVVAVMAVDWGGLPCSYDALRLASEGVPIIEDAAHAFLAQYHDKSVAKSGGDYVVYSFQAIKHLTTGDGGLLVLPDTDTYQRAKLLRWYGLDRTSTDAMRSRQDIFEVGYKFHMNDIAASIGIGNLSIVQNTVDTHRHNAAYYDQYLWELRPDWPTDRISSFWLYTIRVQNPIGFEQFARENGFVASQTHMRNDKYTVFSKYRNERLPGLDAFSSEMVCIPVGWWLTKEDQDWIIDCVHEWKKRNNAPTLYYS